MPDDPYQVLGVAKDASDSDITKAYRKLAKELHPDLNPGDKAAEERFKQVSAAYRLLSDPEQRRRYDRGEIDASGAERAEQKSYRHYADADSGARYHSASGFGDFEDMSDVFADLFGGRGRQGGAYGGQAGGGIRMRGGDIRYHLDIEFLDAVNGATRRITMPDGATLDLTIPAGTRDGGVLRLKGKGGPGLGGGPSGDALVEISVRRHHLFRREGEDIVIDLPITLDEAVLGAKVEVPTISGSVTMTVPAGSSGGDVLRLKGKGVKRSGKAAGDQRVVLKIALPETVDPELAQFMKTWRENHRYDPRAGMRRAA